MLYINPEIRHKFESLPIDIQNELLSRDVFLESVHDLINALHVIVMEGEE